ncbi:MAG: DUF2178 domain-containing protein [Erysipelotrichia bacterium]|nr:DUF2178 domain-containing protein [Erysipelotrichia bacterium]
MFCRMGFSLNKEFQKLLIVLGAVSLAVGLYLCFTMNDTAGYSMGLFSGMMTGIGAASFVLGIGNLWRIMHMSPEDLKRQQNAANDERVQEVNNRASHVTVIVIGTAALAAALIAALMNHIEVTFTLVFTIYAILICFMISAHQIEKKI